MPFLPARRLARGIVKLSGLSGCLAVFAGATVLVQTSASVASDRAWSEAERARAFDFRIPPGALADALDRFSEQSGLQVVYSLEWLERKRAPVVAGRMSAEQALDSLLQGSGMRWKRVTAGAVAVVPDAESSPDASDPRASGAEDAAQSHIPLMDSVEALALPQPRWSNLHSSFALGINKRLIETPRAVTLVQEESLDDNAVSAIDDLARVAPGTFTPTRFGIQGGIDIRGVPGDIFFRGMKRLNLQGHTPSLLSAASSIEIVRGPPSPIYGMGRIGGYINMVPRASRAVPASDETRRGWLEATLGSYQHREASFDVGGPLQLGERSASYDLYGSVVDSNSYARNVPLDIKVFQGALSVEPMFGRFRLETGLNLQASRTAGALLGRVTQALIDDGTYVRGTPLVNLDLDGSQAIGLKELNTASPVSGALGPNNQPLRQAWAWPTDAQGHRLLLSQFPTVPGIPRTMYDYLVAHPEADPTGLLRGQGVGGPRPARGAVPAGFALDPSTVSYDTLDRRRFAAYERDLRADLYTAYVDLIDDADPDATMKNQLFTDVMRQYKSSNQPFGTEQTPWVLEDKFTLTRRLRSASGLERSFMVSTNLRYTDAHTRQCTGDFSTHRTDVMASTWDNGRNGMTPNATFTNCLENSDIQSGGYPVTYDERTRLLELGTGALLDLELSPHTRLLLGARLDVSRASTVEYAGTTDVGAGTSANPGVLATRDRRASAWDAGASWSASLTRSLPGNLHLYLTAARASVVLDGNDNIIDRAVVEAGHIGQSTLFEAGIKGAPLSGDLFFSAAVYRQQRSGIHSPTDVSVAADATSTRTRGWELELAWTPSPHFSASFYAAHEKTVFDPNYSIGIVVDARTLGFADVVDPATGKVVYPAEAFLYGGRAILVLPAGMREYEEKQGTPNRQMGFNLQLSSGAGLKFLFGGNYFSPTYASRLKVVRLPQAYVFNAGVQWTRGAWQVQLDGRNVFDARYYRAKTGDRLGDVTLTAMPEANWLLSVRRNF